MKKRRKIGALALGFTMAASCCFGNGVISNLGGMLSTVEASTSSIVYNPSTGENGGFTVKANKWSKASSNTVVYNGMVLDVADKVESSTKINFTSDSKGTLVLVFNEGSAGKSILVDGESYEIPSSGVVTASVGAGDHEVLKDSGSSYLYYMEFTGKGGSVETTEATTKADTNSSSVSWNMGNSSFKNLGTISGDVTVNGLTIKATSAKTVNVISDEATVESNTFGYSLALGGSGSLKYRAVAFDTNGQAVVKVTSRSSGSSTRTLMVVGDDGTELGTISAKPDADIASVNINYSGKVYIYSKGSGINIYKVQVDNKSSVEETTKKNTTEATTKKETTTEATTKKEVTTETTTKATVTETTTKKQDSSASSKTVTNFEELVSAVDAMASVKGGGTVYVNAKTIDCTSQLALKSTKGNPVKIVGVQQGDGTYPSLDFTSFRNSTIGSAGPSLKVSTDSNVGVRISGSYYTLENLIIEKAGDNGIQIKGANANYNTVNNCIVRYNNDAGVQITGGASYNTMRFVYSYRNCDVYTLGGNADGFAPKLGAQTGNTFYGCYAWENSDDGWDSFDKTTSGYTKDLSYEECACWNNGNPDIFTGKYDYENGNALDTNLYLVELISNQDKNFVSNYNKGNFSLPTDSFINTSAGKINLSSWTGSNYDGNPNGFKFGSAYTDKTSLRTVKNCLSFGHGRKGFDNNNSTVKASFENCVSFDNGYNYYFPTFSVSKASDMLGFNGKSKDKVPSSVSVTTPTDSAQKSIRSKVEATRKSIVSQCNNNVIPGEVYFNIY